MVKRPSFDHTQQQDRSCSVDASSAAVWCSRGLDRSESSILLCRAGSSQGPANLTTAVSRSRLRLSPCEVQRACCWQQLLPCSTCRSPGQAGARLKPMEAPVSQLRETSTAAIPCTHCLQLSHGEVASFTPRVLQIFFFLLMNQSLGENNAFV